MANCHALFGTFISNLKITTTKETNLITSRDTLRKKTKKWFKENQPDYVLEPFIQGSYKAKTMIRTKEDLCDLDDGYHFHCEPDDSPSQLQKWVLEAVKGSGDSQVIKNKCVRVTYKGKYHIDIPIYKQSDNDDYPWLAVKGKEWDQEESDPKGFTKWYVDKKNDQLTTIVKSLKSWGDTVRSNMPSGLAMTLLAEKHLKPNDRDDVALRDTLKEIKEKLNDDWKVLMPVKPEDNILSGYDESFQERFFKHLDSFIEDANTALEETSQLKASKLWRKHLGQRFPLGEDSSEKEKSNLSSLHGIAATGSYKPYSDE